MKMNWKILMLACIVLYAKNGIAQDKRAYTWIYGGGGLTTSFDGTNAKPIVGQLWPNGTGANAPYYILFGHSNICDSATGINAFMSNGFRAFNNNGDIIENGDTLVSTKYFNSDPVGHTASFTQSSLILPKGSENKFYLFTLSATDSIFDYYKTMSLANNQKYGVPFDLLQYHIVDMNANGGAGKVVAKNIALLQNRRLNKVGMQACKHANGYDWWLLKQAEYDSTLIYRFLVTANGIIGPDSQVFKMKISSIFDERGQASFSKDGSKYCYAAARRHKLFIADFDRCSGLLSNAKVVNIRYDSTQSPGDAIIGRLDSMVCGTCFSPNDSFIYVTTDWNVYQYELNKTDSAAAWRYVQKGCDTTWQRFGYYGNMLRAVDDKIYVGQGSGNFGGLAVINNPNGKGAACGYCPRCLRDNGGYYSPTSPSNMPDYALGAKPSLCWPTAIDNAETSLLNETIIYPNPGDDLINIIKECANEGELIIYNAVGQKIKTIKLKEGIKTEKFSTSELVNGFYLIKVLIKDCANTTTKLQIKH
jgi:hypothetical protein